MQDSMKKEYIKLDKVEGPLIVISNTRGVQYDEVVHIRVNETEMRKGKVVKIEGDIAVVQVFEGTTGISTKNSAVTFTGEPLKISLSQSILGRTFNGIGEPIDGDYPIVSNYKSNINGRPINPVARSYPKHFIQTGISTIDALITLIRGQKLPIFSGNGMAHNELAAQIVKQAKIEGADSEHFAVVFGAMGVRYDDAAYFIKKFEEAGVLDHVVMYLNLADDPISERIATPRCALTAAEYLAFKGHKHVLVVLTDMTSYSEALREISSARSEVPSRKGYPGYLYSDLSTIYERAGMLKDVEGSITLVPILTMPNDDITHPVPDLTGYITEGQISLDKNLHKMSIFPPVAVLPSLSRLMKDGIGEGYTRADHSPLANQLFASYAKVQETRSLAGVIGEDELSDDDQMLMGFGCLFEKLYIGQGDNTNRTIIQTLDLGWSLLSLLPKKMLDRLESKLIDENYDHQKALKYFSTIVDQELLLVFKEEEDNGL